MDTLEALINKDEKLILPSAEEIEYMGRIDFTNPDVPTMIYAGSQIRTAFTGTDLKMIINNTRDYYTSMIGVVIDHQPPVKVSIENNDVDVILTLASGLEYKKHEVIIYKTHDASHYFDFKGLVVPQGAMMHKPQPKPRRRMECFGDSISAGAIVEAVDYVGKLDPEDHDGKYCNSWWSYISMTARNLNAQLHNTSQGGIALFDKAGYFYNPDTLGLESTYDKLRYSPYYGELTPWNFDLYIPHVVVMAIGQNDNYPEDYMKLGNEEKKARWKNKYKEVLEALRKHYPKATFILTTTLLFHDASWDRALTEVCEEMNDPHILRYIYKRNGAATPGHIRIPESKEMAEELTAFIESLGEEIWED